LILRTLLTFVILPHDEQAKGYPDLSTRRFLRAICDHKIWTTSGLPPPVFGIFDADPDGINIMQIYRQGSCSLPHERALNVPELQSLGVRMKDVLADIGDDEAVLKLTRRDRTKAVKMLERLQYDDGENEMNAQCKSELQTMLMLNLKAEMQILDDRWGGMPDWLDTKIRLP
jgi:meiotic recombination protein SPO11